MIKEYRNFLEPKSDFWHKAKQYEFQDIDRIVMALQNINIYTTRNSMTLRILGLVKNLGNDNLELTEAGRLLIDSKDRQKVLDEQLLKISLNSPENRRLTIDVFPLKVIFSLLKDLGHLTFEEYQLFVCWISDESEIDLVKTLIKEYREGHETEEIKSILLEKVQALGIKDFSDNIARLFNMFELSSFVTVEGQRFDKVLLKNSSEDKYDKLINALDNVDTEEYEEFDQNYQDLIDFSADHDDITESLEGLSSAERNIIKKSIKEKQELPELDKLNISLVNPQIQQHISPVRNTSTNKKPYKPDYAARENTNRMVGLYAEKVVLKHEFDHLVRNGQNELANQITHVSLEDDSLGYDIVSFDFKNNKKEEKHIEVKAVSGYPASFQFHISENELSKAKNDPNFCLYIVFDYRTDNPKVWKMPNIFNPLDRRVTLTPTSYIVKISLTK